MRQGLLQSTDPRLPEIVERLKAGASLLSQSQSLGYTHNGVLRAALRKHLRGAEQYDAVMSARSIARKKGKKSPVPAASAEGSAAS